MNESAHSMPLQVSFIILGVAGVLFLFCIWLPRVWGWFHERHSLRAYLRSLTHLLEARAAAGGTLSDDEEANFIGQLDKYWYDMTPDQQDEVEAALRRSAPKSSVTRGIRNERE